MAIPYLSLFSGNGGLDLAVTLALPSARCLCYVERDLASARELVESMDAGALDRADIWSDVTTFDASSWRGIARLVVGGFPCQPVSKGRHSDAGLRGLDDARWLWDDLLRIFLDSGADWLIAENVPGLLSAQRGLAMRRVLTTLAEMGLAAVWCCVDATAVGASQQRERFFLLAYRVGEWDGLQTIVERMGEAAEREANRHSARPGGATVGDGFRAFPPLPGDWDVWSEALAAEPDLYPLAYGAPVATPADVRSLGNMVCPQQGALAIRLLLHLAALQEPHV